MTDALIRRLRELAAQLEREPPPAQRAARLAALLDTWERAAGRGPAPDREPAVPVGEDFAPTAEAPIHIWCDGSCAPNPGPGGWGAIVEQDGRRMELSGAAPASTNNMMEMTAAIEALGRTPPGAQVQVTTDSRYLADGITRWLPGWKRKGWRKADGKPVLNQPLWQALDALVRERRVRWHWVEGHTGHPENERCDVLANGARRRQ